MLFRTRGVCCVSVRVVISLPGMSPEDGDVSMYALIAVIKVLIGAAVMKSAGLSAGCFQTPIAMVTLLRTVCLLIG